MLTSTLLALSMLNTTYCGGMCCAPRSTPRAMPPKATPTLPASVQLGLLLATPQPWRSAIAPTFMSGSR